MSEQIPLGDTTYPHTPSLVERLRLDRTRSMYGSVSNITIELETISSLAADRIEQLERELAEAKKSHARYEYVRKLTPQSFNVLWAKNLHGYAPFDELIDAAINGVKA